MLNRFSSLKQKGNEIKIEFKGEIKNKYKLKIFLDLFLLPKKKIHYFITYIRWMASNNKSLFIFFVTKLNSLRTSSLKLHKYKNNTAFDIILFVIMKLKSLYISCRGIPRREKNQTRIKNWQSFILFTINMRVIALGQ